MSLDVDFARLIDAPPEEVFDAFVSPAGQEAFYGQDDPGWIVRSQCDLRVGGVWTVEFGPSPRELYRHRHVFEAVERPHRLALASTETRVDGSSFHTKLEFMFEASGGKTLMTMSQKGFPTVELREEHQRGVPNALARLERLILLSRTPTDARHVSRAVSKSLDLELDAMARQVIDANHYMTLATRDPDGRPRLSPVYYTCAWYLDFYWVSSPQAQHSRNLAQRPEVEIVIFDSTAPVGEGEAVYVAADATAVSDDDLDRACAEAFRSTSAARRLTPDELRGSTAHLYVAHLRSCEVHVAGDHPVHGRGVDARLATNPASPVRSHHH